MPVLHVPDEPAARAEGWLAAVLDGRELEDVLTGRRRRRALALDPLAVSGLDRPQRRRSSGWSCWVTGARSGSGWPASGRGHSAAPVSSVVSPGASRTSNAPGRERAGAAAGAALVLNGVTVRREGVPVLAGVDWQRRRRRPLGRPRAERVGQDDPAPGGRGSALADGRIGGGPRSAPGPGRRPDASSPRGPGQRCGHPAATGRHGRARRGGQRPPRRARNLVEPSTRRRTGRRPTGSWSEAVSGASGTGRSG